MSKLELFNEVVDEKGRIECEKNGTPCISISTFKIFLNQNKDKDVIFDIATLGGDLATGLLIHDLIKAHSGKTKANLVGLTASAGTIIAMACDEIEISENALFLIHNGWKGPVTGNVYDFQKAASDLSKMDAVMVRIYRERTGLVDARIKELMKASDWLSPYEAESMGFVDSIKTSNLKVAASAILASAKDKINKQLLIKLESKMKNPFKAKAETMNVLALKDGNSMLMNAAEAATGVEVAPLGAMSLEDGEYELSDGRKILVTGGTITEVIEKEEPQAAAKEEDEMVATVATMLTASEAKIEAMIEAKLKPLQAMISSHTPPKDTGPVNTPNASVTAFDTLQAKVEAKQQAQKEAAELKRKGQ